MFTGALHQWLCFFSKPASECLNVNSWAAYILSADSSGSHWAVLQITQVMGNGTRTSFSQGDQRHATCLHRPLRCPLWAQTTEGQAAPSPKQTPHTCQVRLDGSVYVGWKESTEDDHFIRLHLQSVSLPSRRLSENWHDPRRHALIGGHHEEALREQELHGWKHPGLYRHGRRVGQFPRSK